LNSANLHTAIHTAMHRPAANGGRREGGKRERERTISLACPSPRKAAARRACTREPGSTRRPAVGGPMWALAAASGVGDAPWCSATALSSTGFRGDSVCRAREHGVRVSSRGHSTLQDGLTRACTYPPLPLPPTMILLFPSYLSATQLSSDLSLRTSSTVLEQASSNFSAILIRARVPGVR